ncbi:amyloid fiber anchoring/assembly protein TapA [Lederbergia graminis]
MRKSRLMKYRNKHKKLIITVQIVTILYLLLLSFTLLTSNTVAYLSGIAETKSSISTAKYWWDKSDLQFIGKGTQVIQGCPPLSISVDIKNIGQTMTDSTKYEIYYSEKNGNPEKHGKKIADGVIEPLEAGEITSLTYDASKEGWYIFKALQRDGYKGDYENKYEIWSEKVRIHCQKVKTEESNEENNKKTTDEEITTDQKSKEEASTDQESSEELLEKEEEVMEEQPVESTENERNSINQQDEIEPELDTEASKDESENKEAVEEQTQQENKEENEESLNNQPANEKSNVEVEVDGTETETSTENGR